MTRLLALCAAVWASQVGAQTACAPEDIVKGNLKAKFGERQMFVGVSERGHVVEFWGNDNTETWTAIIVRPGGIACLVDSGIGIMSVEPAGLRL